MKAKYIFILSALSFLAYSCGTGSVDLNPPTIEVSSFTPVPAADDICGAQEPIVFNVTGGDDLKFDVIFKDDVALSQYKVDIHNNFDCHGHGGGSAPSLSIPSIVNQTTDWTVLEVQNISGISTPIAQTLKVPENATAGNYHFHIQVIDESGNDSPFANFYSIKIKNPLDDVIPQINVEQPSNGSFSINKGEKIRFKGSVTDNRALDDGGNGVLYLNYTDLSSGNSFSTDKAFPFDEDGATTFSFDFEYTVPQTLRVGSYRFSLGANDGVRNVADFKFFEVEVK